MRPCPISSLLLVAPLLFSSTFAPASADVLSLDDAIFTDKVRFANPPSSSGAHGAYFLPHHGLVSFFLCNVFSVVCFPMALPTRL
jgi:hypothetical protein